MRKFWAIALALGLSGCGYALVRRGNGIPDSVRTIYVAKVDVGDKNLRAADAIARSLRGEIRRHARFVPVTDPGGADAVLEVRVAEDRTRSAAFDEFDEALSYEKKFVASARLRDSQGKDLWSRDRIGLVSNYGAVPGAVVTSSSSFQSKERLDPRDLRVFDGVQIGENRLATARSNLINDLAREIYASMVRGY